MVNIFLKKQIFYIEQKGTSDKEAICIEPPRSDLYKRRDQASVIIDDYFIIYGGIREPNREASILVLDITQNMLIHVELKGTWRIYREGHTMNMHKHNQIVVFGGMTERGIHLNDLEIITVEFCEESM